MRQRIGLSVFLAIAIGAVAGFWWWTRPPERDTQPPLLAASAPPAGFERALAPRDFTFPADHGPHVDFQTEWWYYTGNVQAENGNRYGYQLTIFRRGLTPGESKADSLLTNQVYFAHFAITDVANADHRAVERFSRGAAGLAGAQGQPTYSVWLEDWRVESLNADGSALRADGSALRADGSALRADGSVVRLRAADKGMALDLELRSAKPPALQGNRGLSPKSDAPGNASYYVSFTRLATTGTLTLDGRAIAVNGDSWFDHEWSTSALGPNGRGWDWFSLQLSDGRELMLFQIRNTDGSIDPVSSGTLIDVDGSTTYLPAADLNLTPVEIWRSPDSGAEYPIAWRVSIPSLDLDLTVRGQIPAQEMPLAFAYWEGTVAITGTSLGQSISGFGYLEMTGYLGSMQGVF